MNATSGTSKERVPPCVPNLRASILRVGTEEHACPRRISKLNLLTLYYSTEAAQELRAAQLCLEEQHVVHMASCLSD
jgi:hypothetical protein